MGTAADKSGNHELEMGMNSADLGADGQGMRAGICSNCAGEARSRRRTFSEQAWTVLLLWNEINPAAVDQPVCDDCYQEMRDILIDRNHEIEAAMQQSDEVARIKQRLGNIAS